MKKLFLFLLAVIVCESTAVLPTWEAGPRVFKIKKDGVEIYNERVESGKTPAVYELAKTLVETQDKVSILEAK